MDLDKREVLICRNFGDTCCQDFIVLNFRIHQTVDAFHTKPNIEMPKHLYQQRLIQKNQAIILVDHSLWSPIVLRQESKVNIFHKVWKKVHLVLTVTRLKTALDHGYQKATNQRWIKARLANQRRENILTANQIFVLVIVTANQRAEEGRAVLTDHFHFQVRINFDWIIEEEGLCSKFAF